MVFSVQQIRRKSSTLYVLIKRNAQSSRKEMVHNPEYSLKAKAMATMKLKYGTENETKRKYLTESRNRIDGSMQQYAKYMSLLKEKSNQINHKKSIQILRECESDGITPNIVLYSKVLANCSRCFAPNMLSLKLLEEMIIKYEIEPNCIIFSSILNLFFKNGAYHDCIVLFGLTRRCISMDFKALLKDYTKSREISYIVNHKILLDALKEIECNLICINIILKCIGKLGDMKKVTQCFQAMIKSNLVPNDVTLNSMINIFASTGINWRCSIRALFNQGLIGEALNLFEQGSELNVLKYLSPQHGSYSMDLHHFDVASAVIALMHNLKTLCTTLTSRGKFKIPSIWMVVGRGKHSPKDNNNAYKYVLLKDTLPDMLRDERLFYPKLDTYTPHWNPGIMKLDDECLLKYLAFQLKMDIEELRPRFHSMAENEHTS